jgi:hypothetical protein
MDGRVGGWILAGVVVLGLIGYKFMKKDEVAENHRQQMVAFLEELPDFDTHGSLYMQWFDANHDWCFEENFTMGSRRIPARFDGEGYLDDIFPAMITAANDAGYADQAKQLRTLADELYWGEE